MHDSMLTQPQTIGKPDVVRATLVKSEQTQKIRTKRKRCNLINKAGGII